MDKKTCSVDAAGESCKDDKAKQSNQVKISASTTPAGGDYYWLN